LGPITQQGLAGTSMDAPVGARDSQTLRFDPQAAASAAFQWELRDVLPAIRLEATNGGGTWLPQHDLLSSDRFALEFVVEIEDDGRSYLRFGDGILGSLPENGLTVTYRIGNGSAGNVGAEAIAHVITNQADILNVRNPLPARGGTEPESLDQVRLYAPQAFRTQERAVTEADYAAAAERHPEVQKAAATRRWTGSWYTMFVTVDRKRGQSVDADFREELRAFLERFRLAGYDLEVDAPLFVPLDIALTVCVAPEHFRSNVKQALLEAFSNRDLPGGRRGFFHPDDYTFGQPVYLSQLLAAAMRVPGVAWVDADDTFPKPNRFKRWGQVSRGEVADSRIALGRLEIARLDNDPNRPENGKIEFFLQGGM
jgi:predicted phage baseplate assembly protein